jgi:dTDP-4-dehydrorhamnose reductase
MNDYLILGHKGYLGSFLSSNIDCDVLEDRNIYDNGKKYKFIINCIGKASLEYCEIHRKETDYSNALVINDIKKFYPKSKIINFSSYYVYDSPGLCAEDSATTSKYNYCRQKLLGESLNSEGLNFRIGKLFGNDLSNQKKLTEYIIKEDELFIDEILFNPTSVYCVLQVLKNKKFLLNAEGTFNLSNTGIVSHYDYAKYIIDKLSLKKKLYKIEKAPKSFDNYGYFTMSVDKILEFCEIDNWQDDLNFYLELINDKVYRNLR